MFEVALSITQQILMQMSLVKNSPVCYLQIEFFIIEFYGIHKTCRSYRLLFFVIFIFKITNNSIL